MKILISGASGYIGISLVEWCRDMSLSFGVIARSVPNYLKQRVGHGEVIRWDIRDTMVGTIVENYDCLIHLAAATDRDSRDPKTAIEVNALGTRNILEFCVRNGIKQMIYISTFQVYGKTDGVVSEETELQCCNDYALTHWFAEEYVRAYGRQGLIEHVILRPTNVYGAPVTREVDRWDLVPNCFCHEVLESEKIVLRSSGRQLRDFLALEDAVEAILFVATHFSGCKNETFNVATGQSESILSVAERVKRAFEHRFGRGCTLVVSSDEPKSSKPLHVSGNKLASRGWVPVRGDKMDAEIQRIFDVLEGGASGSDSPV
jgi:UDP-glucose 4-epimerase